MRYSSDSDCIWATIKEWEGEKVWKVDDGMVGGDLKAMTVSIQSSAQYVANEENEAQQWRGRIWF